MSMSTVDQTIQQDLAWCEAVIRRHSSSFHRAFRHLPRPKAQAVFAIYAFCRLADDAIDEDHDPAALQRLASDLERFAQGETPDEPLWRALRWAFSGFGLDIGPFREMLQGQMQDVDFRQPADRSELEAYCYLVAGTVGLMICPLLATPVTGEVYRLSIDLGIAMQLTNILRDIGADYRMGRIYLPSDRMRHYGVLPEHLNGPEPNDGLNQLWEELARDAETRYARLRSRLEVFDRGARLPVLLSLLYYSHILKRCRSFRRKMLIRRIYVPKWQKCLLFVRAQWQVLLGSR